MSSELDTLDNLVVQDLPLNLVRQYNYADDDAFLRGVYGLLRAGDVELRTANDEAVPAWQWRELFDNRQVLSQLAAFRLSATEQGLSRVV
jgi:hypothetical protein